MLKRTLAALCAVTSFSTFAALPHHNCNAHSMLEEYSEEKVDYKFLTQDDADYQEPNAPVGNLVIDARLRNFAGDSRVKVLKAIEVMQIVINSREFQEKILNFTWNGQRQFNDNKGLSNEQIYADIMAAQEEMFPDSAGVVNLDLSLYTPKWWQVTQRNVIGYTNPGSPRIYMNTKFFNKFEPSDVADNMTHEWIHQLGYSHDFYNNPDRPYSVPYAVGYIAEELAVQVLKGAKLTSLR